MITLTLFVILIFTFFFKLIWHGTYWFRKGVNGPRGMIIMGNMFDFIVKKKHYGHVYEEIYKAYPDVTYVGIYRLLNDPAILVRSLDLVKQVMVTHFSNFHDNAFWVDEKQDRLASINPFVAKGERWKIQRNEIVNVFTPSKIRSVFPHIIEVCSKLEYYVANECINNVAVFEAKELCSKYTLEVVATCAYGLDGQTFSNPNSDFTLLVKDLFQPHALSLLETISILFLPSLGKLLKYRYIPEKIEKWLRSIIREVLKEREHFKKPKNDFLQSILDLRNKKEGAIDEVSVVGHCLTFLLEGFETSSTLIAFALYELSINPHIQRRVQVEIDSVLITHGGFTYSAMENMCYLENVMLETLRMHPPMYALAKVCTKPFNLPAQYKDSKSAPLVHKGTCFIIPVWAIHYDPAIYPNPDEFYPDRFNDKNQKQRNNCAFLAFGEGPRMCPGMRFGLLQSKTALATLLAKYTVSLMKKTKTPIEISPTTFLLSAKDGIWVNLHKRCL